MIGSSSTEGGSSSSATPTPDEKNKSSGGPTDEEQEQLSQLTEKWKAMTFEESEISSLIESVRSTELEKEYYGVIGLRKLLCKEQTPPIQTVLDSGIAPKLIQLLRSAPDSKIQFEAAWCLTNLCSGTSQQVAQVIDFGVIPAFISTLQSADHDLVEQSIWGLGNIAGDSTPFRDMVIQSGGVEAMVNALEHSTILTLKRNGTWALSNMCRGKPAPPFALISKAIPLFCNFLKNESDVEIHTDAAWGLFKSSGEDEGINAILSYDVTSTLVHHLSSSNLSLLTACIRIIGSIISGTHEQTSVVLKEKDFLPALLSLSSHQKKIVRKEAFWIISNITTGQPVQFESIMGNPTFVERIMNAAKNEVQDIQREAIFALADSTLNGTPAQIIRLLKNGVFQCLVELLDLADPQILPVILDGIKNCLKWGVQFNLVDENGVNRFLAALEENEGVDKIEKLQTHDNEKVSKKALSILETYFEIDEQ